MNKLVQKIAFASLVTGSALLPLAASPAQARPVEYRVYERTTVPYERVEVREVIRPVSYLPSYIRTSEYCESRRTSFSGAWTRRGSAPIYDVVWTSDRGEKVYGVVDVVENYDGKLLFNYRAGQDSGYYQVRFDNRDLYIGTWKSNNGRYYGSVTGYIQL
jgi:hypothetical protein